MSISPREWRLRLGVLAGCASLVVFGGLNREKLHNPVFARGWVALKPRVSEEKNMTPVFHDIGHIPYPGDAQSFGDFVRRRSVLDQVRRSKGLEGSGSRMSDKEKEVVRRTAERQMQLDEYILSVMKKHPKQFENMTLDDVKYRKFDQPDWETHPLAPQILERWERRFQAE